MEQMVDDDVSVTHSSLQLLYVSFSSTSRTDEETVNKKNKKKKKKVLRAA